MQTNRPFLRALLVISLTALAGLALAADIAPAAAVKARQENLKQMGQSFKTIRDQLKASAPDMNAIKAASAKIAKLAPDAPNWFPQGSGPEAGVKTGAKPEIWSDPDGFAAALKKLADEAPKLAAAAESGQVDQVKQAMPGLGGACKGCHDKYRVPE